MTQRQLLALTLLCTTTGAGCIASQRQAGQRVPGGRGHDRQHPRGDHIRPDHVRGVVQAYIARAKAYNGVCTSLVTADGADIPPAKGYVRAGSPLVFPTRTVAASTVFPDLNQYKGLPLDYGRMEPAMSDPSVLHQMGMRVGMPNAGQFNALETINIRGERSVTCKGAFDAHPSTGPLPAGAPPMRALPPATGRPGARRRARRAVLERTPTSPRSRCTASSSPSRIPYDTKDMRTTSNSDVDFAMDVPPFDSTIAAQLRAKGAIIYAKSVAAEFNGGPGNPGGPAKPKTNYVAGGQQTERLERSALQPLRHGTRAARNEQRIRSGRLGEPGDGRHLRTDGRLVSGPRVEKRHRAPADHQGGDAGQRRHRQPGIHRPRRDPRAHAWRCRPRARRDQGSSEGLLRPARPVHRPPEGLDSRSALRQFCRG